MSLLYLKIKLCTITSTSTSTSVQYIYINITKLYKQISKTDWRRVVNEMSAKECLQKKSWILINIFLSSIISSFFTVISANSFSFITFRVCFINSIYISISTHLKPWLTIANLNIKFLIPLKFNKHTFRRIFHNQRMP